MLEVVRAVARGIFIPFSVGGGLRTLDDIAQCCSRAPRKFRSILARCEIQN